MRALRSICACALTMLASFVLSGRAAAQGATAEAAPPPAAEAAADPCAAGKAQSPVEIVPEDTMHSSLLAPSPNYEPTGVVLWNTGKNLRVDFNPGTPAPPWKGNFIVLDGVRYDLVELHFHRPAEHAFDTMSPAPVMEVHLVHADSRGNLAVVGLPIALGATTTPALEPLLKAIPRGPGDRALLPAAYNAGPLIPNRAVTAYRYPGSLTTPPYAECVRWTVLWHTLYISQTHFAAYKERFPGQYYRDTQPLNGRVLLRMSTRP